MDIKLTVPKDEIHLEVRRPEVNFPERKGDKKNLARLSDEEPAHLSPDGLCFRRLPSPLSPPAGAIAMAFTKLDITLGTG